MYYLRVCVICFDSIENFFIRLLVLNFDIFLIVEFLSRLRDLYMETYLPIMIYINQSQHLTTRFYHIAYLIEIMD